jgi:hypothetical protein
MTYVKYSLKLYLEKITLDFRDKSILYFAGWDTSAKGLNYYLTKWLNDLKIPMVYFYKHVKENLPQTGLFPFAIVWYPK